jgi:formiminotetrahydrofolate cyclodeaminase
LTALREVIDEDESDVFESVWRERAYKLGISDSNKEESRRKAFQRAKEALIKSGKVVVKNKQYSIAE